MKSDEAGAVVGYIVWGPVDHREDVGFDYKEVKSYHKAFSRGKT